ncbi:MAG TPA: hypothetical protein VKQ08_00710 [Cyclobacteriaceae bacterium]|nr:hypothetical protein [Cyclobacteriaceae bacterium]
MMRKNTIKGNIVFLSFGAFPFFARTQSGDFAFGRITNKELEMKIYPADTSAAAVVLSEFGEARFDDHVSAASSTGGTMSWASVNIVFDYHIKIKILKKEGLKKGNFEVPLHKDGNTVDREEAWLSLQATTFNSEGCDRIKFNTSHRETLLKRDAAYEQRC